MKKIAQYVTSLAVILLVGSNLRAPITALSPVLVEINAYFHLTNVQASLLTSIPLAVFALGSIAVVTMALRFGVRQMLLASVLILMAGLYLRVYGTMFTLYLGSFLLGIGICVGNVLVPAYIKKVFPHKIGIMTGVFTVAMNVFAALASGFSIAIGKITQLQWQGSLGVWVIPSALALLAIVTNLMLTDKEGNASNTQAAVAKFNVFRSKQAWYISVFMGLQSLVYYCLVALLPSILSDYGMKRAETGMVLLVIQLAMMPVLFISPVLATRLKDQKWMVLGIGGMMFTGIALLPLFQLTYVYLAAVLIGMASGSAFSLAILFFSMKSKTGHGLVKVSGKAQSVGYMIAAFGPPIFGALHDASGTWTYSFYFLLLVIIIMTILGRRAAKPRFIEEH